MPSTASLVCVNPADVSKFWPHVKVALLGAIERQGLSDPNEYEASVLSGHQLLWLAWSEDKKIEAAATTHLIRVGSQVICVLTACAGYQRERWLPLFKKIEDYARAEGAVSLRVYGRPGWQRVLEGYTVENVVLEKRLT